MVLLVVNTIVPYPHTLIPNSFDVARVSITTNLSNFKSLLPPKELCEGFLQEGQNSRNSINHLSVISLHVHLFVKGKTILRT